MPLLTLAIFPRGDFEIQARLAGVDDHEFCALLAGAVDKTRIAEIRARVDAQYRRLVAMPPQGAC